MNQFIKFLMSNKNIFGLGSSSIIVLLAIFGVLKALWFPLAAVAYILGYLLAPQDKKQITFSLSSESDFSEYIDFLGKIDKEISNNDKLNKESKIIVSNIIDTSLELFQFLHENKENNLFDDELSNIKSIFNNYLPKLINQYQKLPTRYANTIKSKSTDKTATEMLIEQLTLLDEKIKDIAHSIYENDVTALKVNGQFLKKKFQAQDNYFELG